MAQHHQAVARTAATLLLATAIGFVATGCATPGPPPVRVSVSSLASPDAGARKTFVLLPSDKATPPDDLQFREYARTVTAALIENGFRRSETGDDADVLIFLAYSVGPPTTEQFSYSIPTFGQTGVLSSSTNGTLSRNGQYSSTTTYAPSFGVTGAQQVTDTRTNYRRSIVLLGYDAGSARANQAKQLWATSIISVGQNGDLRSVFPYLIRGAAPYIGRDSGQVVTVVVPVAR